MDNARVKKIAYLFRFQRRNAVLRLTNEEKLMINCICQEHKAGQKAFAEIILYSRSGKGTKDGKRNQKHARVHRSVNRISRARQ